MTLTVGKCLNTSEPAEDTWAVCHSKRKGKQLTNKHTCFREQWQLFRSAVGPCSHPNEKGVVFKFVCTLVISSYPFLVISTSTNNYKTKTTWNTFMPHLKKFTLQFCAPFFLWRLTIVQMDLLPKNVIFSFYK